ncbi:hypothetical protein LSH36_179g03020 [Paralvinella palmiformis]|uniref:Uncharacterized protein n=1 Tax=Paralvinella palmiformis TaxID=53620 RepID=A0AAD9JRT0_9ANNE|nr:hypothetical protein LSH36_179g03020 [Paralvinella palmiformis]
MERNLRRSISFAGTPGLAGRSTVYTVSQLTYYYEDDTGTNRGESRIKRWAKKLGFKKSRDGGEQREGQGHVLRGEFVLREQPIDDVLAERHRGRLKFRPVPLSFPHLDEIEKDIDMTKEKTKSSVNFVSSREYNDQRCRLNGILPLYPDAADLDSDGGRLKSRVAPSPPPRTKVRRLTTTDRGAAVVDRNHNRRQENHVQSRAHEQNVSSVAEGLERLDVNEPCFVGAFRKDNGSPESTAAMTKRQAPLPPNNPVAPPRKKKEKRKKKHKVKIAFVNVHHENDYDEPNDIEEVMSELHDLYSGNMPNRNASSSSSGFTNYMQWPSQQERCASGSLNPAPAEPPEDYSPERTTPSSETHYSSIHTSSTSVPSGEDQPNRRDGRYQTPSISITSTYEEVTNATPPPPPPLPGLNVSHEIERKPSVPLASDLITQRKQLRKTQGPNRKSRARTRTEHRSKASTKEGAKVSKIRDVLEEKGILEPYLYRACGRSCSFDDTYQMLGGFASGESSRDNSPMPFRDGSSTSPREVSPASRFTYLPNGILTKPALKKIRRNHAANLEGNGSQHTRRHTVSFKTSPEKITDSEYAEEPIVRNDKQHSSSGTKEGDIWNGVSEIMPSQRQITNKRCERTQSVGPDLSADDYNKLQATLRMHLEKPRELPKVNMRAVRQYEKLPDPPSELELFFKKRRQKMALEKPELSNTDLSVPDSNGDPESINAMSRLIEKEAQAGRKVPS